MKSPHISGVILGICLAIAVPLLSLNGAASRLTPPVEPLVAVRSQENSANLESLQSATVVEVTLLVDEALARDERQMRSVVLRTALSASYGSDFEEMLTARAYWIEIDPEFGPIWHCTDDYTFAIHFDTETVLVELRETVVLK